MLTIELVFALLFGAKAAFRGTKTAVRTVAKQGVRGATRTGAKVIATGAGQSVRNTAKAVKDLGTVGRNGVRAIANNGKVAMKGVRKGFARGAKTFDDLGQRLAKKFRFRKFRIRVRKRRFKLEGEINPWVLLASGEVRKVALEDIGSAKVGDKIKIDGADATILADGRYITPGKKFKDHFIRHKGLLENILGKKYPKYKTHGAEFLSDVGKVIEDGTVSMVGRGTLKKGQPVLNIFRGKGLTIATKPDGEFVTILETGKGMDLGIQFIP